MTGKLWGRGMRLPARDVFDICVAGRADPGALRCAVNHMPQDTRSEVAHLLLLHADVYREEAPEQILAPAAEYVDLLEDAPEIAADLMVQEAYEEDCTLHFSETQVVVSARTRGGTQVSRTCTTGTGLAETLREMGLEATMAGRAGSVHAFIAAADAKLSGARPGGTGGPPM